MPLIQHLNGLRDATFQRGHRRMKKDVQNLLQKQLAKKD